MSERPDRQLRLRAVFDEVLRHEASARDAYLDSYLEGSTPLALRCLHDAANRFERAEMNLYLAVARRRIGAVQDDEHGRELRLRAEAWMAAQTIKNPAGMTRMLAPGFPVMQ